MKRFDCPTWLYQVEGQPEPQSQGELNEAVDHCLEHLTDALRLAWVRRYRRKQEDERAAEELGISVTAFRARVCRASMQLAPCVRGRLAS